MSYSIKNFNKIADQFNSVYKFLKDGEVNIRCVYSQPGYIPGYFLSFSYPKFENVDKMYQFSKAGGDIPTGQLICDSLQDNTDFLRGLSSMAKRSLHHIDREHSRLFSSLKLIPSEVHPDYTPKVILHSPEEITENGHTYRFLTNHSDFHLVLVCREDDALYDYLDKGFYLMQLKDSETELERKFVVSNSYDIHTAHIFMMCKLQPDLTKFLKNECFINKYDAETLRLKLTKNLSKGNRIKYNDASPSLDRDYRKNTTLIVVGKIISGEIEGTMLQNIQFYKNKAVYDRVTIEADNLLSILHENLNFDGEFDIYTVCGTLAKHLEGQLNKTPEPVDPEDRVVLPEVKINNIPIQLALNSSCQRFINKSRINKDEIAKAIQRASCYHSAEEYKLFLRSTSNMSIKLHDVVANGLQIKVHDMTSLEYRSETPSLEAPALKFFIDAEGKYRLEISSDRSVRVHLGRLVKRVETINKKTDNKYYYSTASNSYRSGYRNNTWAVEQIVKALIECCTFNKEVTLESGEKKTVEERLITKEDILTLMDVVKSKKREAIERSKIFMETAVKMTGAELVEFMGKRAYKVSGGLRTYAVVIENAKVYDFDTKQYRCIVNDHHYDGAGYDDIATRLLALKNDSVLQESVVTLRGAAQPQYENAHAHTPERDVQDSITQIVENLVNKA